MTRLSGCERLTRFSPYLGPAIVLCFANVGWTQHESVPDLLKQLKSEKKQERLHAIQKLGERGPTSFIAVPQLVRILESDDLTMRHEALIALGKIDQESGQVIPAVISVLSDPSPVIRHSAIDCLREFKTDAKAAIPQLKGLLSDRDPVIRVAAARALVSVAPDDTSNSSEITKVLIAGLESSDTNLTIESVRGLTEVGPSAAPAIIKLLSSNRPQTVILACDSLGAMGSRAATAGDSVIPALITATSSSDIEIRLHALDALGGIGAQPDLAFPVLKRSLSDKSEKVRIHAARSLGDFGSAGQSVVPDLMHALKDPEHSVRETAAGSLGRIGQAAAAAVPALVKALHDPDGMVTIHAAEALGRIGKASVPSLVEKLNDSSYQLLAATVLAEIGPDAVEAVPALTKLIHSKKSNVAGEALLALGAVGPGAKQSIPAVIKELSDAKSSHRAAAAFALGKMKSTESVAALKSALETTDDPMLELAGAAALLEIDSHKDHLHLALPKLSKALANKHVEIRIEAAAALARIGSPAKASIPALRKALKDENLDLRTEVLMALASFGADSHAAVPDIIVQLSDPEPEIREVACHTLGRIGASAKEAVPILQRLVRSSNRDERTDAAWALALIAPDPETTQAAIPLVIGVLQSSAPATVRMEAAATLGKLGHGSTDARQALKAATNGSNEFVRHAAQKALDQMK